MANALYDKGREKFLTGAINASADTLKCALIKDTYAPTLGSDEFFSTLSSHVVGTPQTLTSKTVTGGVLDAADNPDADLEGPVGGEGERFGGGGGAKVDPVMRTISIISPPPRKGGMSCRCSRRAHNAPVPVGPHILWPVKA